ncbi:MAG: hypothetical protein C0594_02990 [Marinilabiliales bacterium]|nr:MAG: hypothetical protein C0594_02990 [Marinilabiliales bacterium]
MKGTIIFCCLVLFFLVSCGSSDKVNERKGNENKFGGTLRINETDLLLTTYPPSANDKVSSHIISQVYDGLVKYDPNNLSIVPAIAKRWEIDTSGTVYTFYLRDNVYFHDNPCFKGGKGRKVTAEDFKFSFELLSSQSEENNRFNGTIDQIKGAKKFYEASAMGRPGFDIEGVEVVCDTVLKLHLEKENPLYIYLLADISAVVLPWEAIEEYGTGSGVGSGPFILENLPPKGENLVLTRNNKYYLQDEQGNYLPYLDTIIISFEPTTVKELTMFEQGKLDIITGLTGDYIPDFIAENISRFESNPPEFIIDGSDDFAAYELYNIRKSDVYNFFSNRMNVLDLSIVYKGDPQELTKEEEEQATEL